MASLDVFALGAPMTGMGYEQLTISTASLGLTPPTVGGVKASRALVIIESNTVRWRCDGTAPTSSVGMLSATAPVEIALTGPAIGQFRAIRAGASDAAVSVMYFD